MSYEAGTAFVQIIPSFQGVVEKISEQASQWGDAAGKAFKQTFQDATKGLNLGPSDADSSKQGASAGGAFADGFRAKVDAALKALPDANVTLNDATAQAKLDELRARLETLRGVEIGIDVSDTEALAAVEIIKGELDELARKSPSIRVKVDAAEASAELGAISAESDAAGGGFLSLGGDAEAGGAGVGGLIAALAVLATALIPIGGLAAGALSTLPALLAGAASGLGALKIGFSGVMGAVQAYTAQQNKAAAASGASGSSATSAAQQALSAAASEASAAQAVASAEEALGNARTQAADSVHKAQEQLTQSEQALMQAEQSEENAQRSLTQARIDAANTIVSLNDQVKDGALAIQQATLDATTAQQALTKAQGTPGISAAALAQASLSAQEAQQHVQDLTDQQAQLTQQQQAATAAGVDGSDKVIAATQALGQAQQTVGNDQQAQIDAQNALTETQASAVQKVQDAQTNLTNALASQARTLQQVALQQEAAAASGSSAASGTNAFAKAMAGLSPAGRSFVDFVTSTLLPMYNDFKAKVQAALLPGIQVALEALVPVFQTIAPFVVDAAKGIGDFAQNLAGVLSSGPGLFNLSVIFQAGAGFMRDLASAALAIIPAFLTIGAQAAPVVAALGSGIDHIVGAFAKWVANGGFEKFLAWLKANGPGIVSSISGIAKTIGGLTVSLAPTGILVLKILGYFTSFLGILIRFDPLLAVIVPLIVLLGVVILPVIVAIAAMSATVGIIIGAIVAFIFVVTLLVTHWTAVWDTIKAVAAADWDWLQANFLDPLINFFTVTIPHAFDAVVGFFGSLPGRIGGALTGVFVKITGAFGDVAGWVNTNIIQPVGGFFSALPGDIAKAMSSGAKAAGSALSAIGKDVVNGIIGALNGIIDTIDGDLSSVSFFGFHPFPAKTIPDIPTLHSGGIVPGPAGADVPAILQAGERVVSRADLSSISAAPGGTSEPTRIYSPTFEVQAFDPQSAAITMQQKSDFAAKTRGF